MTSNQVNWVNAMENRRSNIENEAIKRDANAISAQHYARQDQETQRSNMAQEAIKQEANNITRGYYAATTAETYRSNVAKETETNRSNLAQEALKTRGLNIESYGKRTERMNAKTNQKNAVTNAKNAATNAYNAQINAMNARTNLAGLQETIRSNKASEDIRRDTNAINSRYNEAMIGYTGTRVSNETALAAHDARLKEAQKRSYNATTEETKAKTETELRRPALVTAQERESRSKKISNYLNAGSNLLDTLSKYLPALSGGGF